MSNAFNYIRPNRSIGESSARFSRTPYLYQESYLAIEKRNLPWGEIERHRSSKSRPVCAWQPGAQALGLTGFTNRSRSGSVTSMAAYRSLSSGGERSAG